MMKLKTHVYVEAMLVLLLLTWAVAVPAQTAEDDSTNAIGTGAELTGRAGAKFASYFYVDKLGHASYDYLGLDDTSQDIGYRVWLWEVREMRDDWSESDQSQRMIPGGDQGTNTGILSRSSSYDVVDNTTINVEYNVTFNEVDSSSQPLNFSTTVRQSYQTDEQEEYDIELLWNPWKMAEGRALLTTEVEGWKFSRKNFDAWGENCCRKVRLTYQIESFRHESSPEWWDSDCPGSGAPCTLVLHPFIDWFAQEEEEGDGGPPDPSKVRDSIGKEEDRGLGEIQLKFPGKVDVGNGEKRKIEVQWTEEVFDEDAYGGRAMRHHIMLPANEVAESDGFYNAYGKYVMRDIEITLFSAASSVAASTMVVFFAAFFALIAAAM